VYVVVAVGLTDCVPPSTGREYVVWSVPVIDTKVAFAAVTVKVDAFPEMTDVGFAVMLTVGAGFAVTVTVARAEVLPPAPVAAAVYVAVVVGLTSSNPPLGCKVYELPSVPVTVTCVA
jgi:hypothetical protein